MLLFFFSKSGFWIYRTPLLLMGLSYFILCWISPNQITHIIEALSREDIFAFWPKFIIPIVLATYAHVSILRIKTNIYPIFDSILAICPLTALFGLVLSARIDLLWGFVIILIVIFSLTFLFLNQCTNKQKSHNGSKRGDVTTWILILLTCWMVASVIITLNPISAPVFLGLGVLTIGIGLFWLTIDCIFLSKRFALVYLVMLCISSAYFEKKAILPISKINETEQPFFSVDDGFFTWLSSRNDLSSYKNSNRPYPVLMSSSEGGGIYAATHAYLALSTMRDACPNFSQHLFATVGVSGGAIGNLMYASTGTSKNESLQPCSVPNGKVDTSPLTADFLSPVLANLIILQVADFFTPFLSFAKDGGEILAQNLAAALPNNKRIIQPLLTSWKPTLSSPAQVFVTTDVKSGNRFVIGSVSQLGSDTAESFLHANADIQSNRAAVTSARFPWLTSSAYLKLSESNVKILGDGGYFENTGADTVIDAVQQLKSLALQSQQCSAAGSSYIISEMNICECPLYVHSSFSKKVDWEGCSFHIFIAHLQILSSRIGHLGVTTESGSEPVQSYFFDPIMTLLNTRTTRGDLALSRARRYMGNLIDSDNEQGYGVDQGYFYHSMPIEDLKLPLGWRISPKKANDMLELTVPFESCPPLAAKLKLKPSVDTVSDTRKFMNACNMAMLTWLFNPSENAEAFGIPGFQ